MKQRCFVKDFTKYVSLNILGQVAYSCYTMADTFFVSADLGAEGLTALNLAFPVLCLINGLGLMLGMGGGTGYSIMKSRGEKAEANLDFSHAVYLAALFSAVFVILGLTSSQKLTALLGADKSVFDPTHTYLKVMLIFAPAFLFNHLLQCFVRNDDNPSLAMKAMAAGSFSNIVLDYVFIFPMGMGIFGAILATGLAPIISIGVITPYLRQKKCGFQLRLSPPRWRSIGQILSSGIPPLITEVTSGIVMLLFNFIILDISGNVGVAAFSVITVISLVVAAIYTGLSQGMQPIISIHFGKNSKENVEKALQYGLITAAMLSCIIYAVIFFGADVLVSIFNQENNRQLQMLAEKGLKLYFLACPFIGCNIVTATYFASTQRPVPAQIISFSRGIFVLIPIAFLLSALLDMTGVWCAYPVTEAIVAGISAGFYIYRRRTAI